MVKLFDIVEDSKNEAVEEVKVVNSELEVKSNEVVEKENIINNDNDKVVSASDSSNESVSEMINKMIPKEVLDEANRRIANGESNFTIGDSNSKLFENIKNIVSNDKIERKVYFSKKGKVNLMMGNFELAPSKLALLNRRKFYEVYKKELENALFNQNGGEEKVIAMIYLYGKIMRNQYPINVVFKGFNSLEGDVMRVLNDFFNENSHVLRGLYGMFNNELKKEDKIEEKKEDLKESK